MSLIEEIDDEIKDAMRARDAERRDALRLILDALRKSEKELQRPLSEEEELQVMQRERKRRLEAAKAYRDAGRDDLAGGEETEGELIGAYLPAELSDEELQAIVTQAVSDSGATSAKDMGAAMKSAMAVVDGRADGKRVSGLVRAALQG